MYVPCFQGYFCLNAAFADIQKVMQPEGRIRVVNEFFRRGMVTESGNHVSTNLCKVQYRKVSGPAFDTFLAGLVAGLAAYRHRPASFAHSEQPDFPLTRGRNGESGELRMGEKFAVLADDGCRKVGELLTQLDLHAGWLAVAQDVDGDCVARAVAFHF